jgi:hypothetical protein
VADASACAGSAHITAQTARAVRIAHFEAPIPGAW